MLKPTMIVLAVCLPALVLAGCGVRGPLELPPEAKAANAAKASADSGQGKPEGATKKPHEPFILDGMIR